MTKLPGFYTIRQAAETLGLSHIGAKKASKREGWQPYHAGNTHLFKADDVHEYRDHRQRTELVQALGWKGRGLYRADDIDIQCPECGGFAVSFPLPPYVAAYYSCAKGHKGEL